MKIEIMYNNIAKGDYEQASYIPIDMSDSENNAYGNVWCTYQERNEKLENHIGHAYSLILVNAHNCCNIR